MDDELSFDDIEKIFGEMNSKIAHDALYLGSLLMNPATASTIPETESETAGLDTLLGHPVILNDAVPAGEAFLIPRRVMEFDWKPTLEVERAKAEYDEQIAFRFAQRFASDIDALLFGGDYVSLVERLEIPEVFRWSALRVALILSVIMVIIMIIVTYH
jgi:hypothetical protein